MSKTKNLMDEQVNKLLEVLRSYNIDVYEDNIPSSADEKFKNDNIEGYHLFIFETGDIRKSDDKKSLIQDVAVFYYSEKRDDLDDRTVNIITQINQKGIRMLTLERTDKQQFKVKDKERYVDRIAFIYSRKIVLEGCVAL